MKVGRPKLPRGQAKDEIVKLRVTPAERRLLLAHARKLGVSLCGLVRLRLDDILFGYTQGGPITINPAGVERVAAEIREAIARDIEATVRGKR